MRIGSTKIAGGLAFLGACALITTAEISPASTQESESVAERVSGNWELAISESDARAR
ncbi:MAG: hypothetical protein M3Y87_27240 [Myxococcota bacterium]|nr:hypothetical protein [Myxococcota bacterium]